MDDKIILLVLSLSLSGTLLFFGLLILKPFYQKKFSKAWQYYIFLLVILRLLLPIQFELNLIESIFSKVEQQIEQINFTENVSATEIEKGEILERDKAVEKQDETKGSSNTMLVLFLIWLFGAILFFCIKLMDYFGFLRYLKANNEKVTDERILSVADDLLMDYNIKKDIPIYKNKLIMSPVVAGFWKPFVVLPEHMQETDQWRHILSHEFMHYKRKDNWYKWLFQFTFALHWFNPFLFFLQRELNRTCELACDEAVIKKLPQEERKDYGTMLLSVAECAIRYKNTLFSTALIEQKKDMKVRLLHILNFKALPKHQVVLSAITALLLLGAASLIGVRDGGREVITESFLEREEIQTIFPENREEQEEKSDVKWEEIVALAPFAKPSSLSFYLTEYFIENPSEISNLKKVAAFLGSKNIENLLKSLIAEGILIYPEDLIDIGAFMNSETIKVCLLAAIEKEGDEAKKYISIFAPFLKSKDLDELLK